MILVASTSLADDAIAVNRSQDLKLSKEAQQNLQELRGVATRLGEIQVWVDFDIEFQANPELRTDGVIEEEKRKRDELIQKVIEPLVRRGVARIVPLPVETGAPGCLVAVTARGLNRLARNKHVMHIGYLPYEQ